MDDPVHSAFALLTLTLAGAVLVGMLLLRFQQSILIGYFLCGLAIGPGGFDLGIAEQHVALMSEVGVVLLMFTLGIEFSLAELKHLRRIALLGGGVQMAISALLLALVAIALGASVRVAVIAGLLGSLSSTAVVLRVFQDISGGSSSPASRIAIGICIAQDLAAILLTLVLPPLVSGNGLAQTAPLLGTALFKGCIFVGLGWLLSRFLVPTVLAKVSDTRSRELFTLTVLALCAGIAWLASQFGLSLALGAFVAGLIVSETVFSHKILAEILPFKDFYLAVFFVSVGMMIDVRFCLEHWGMLLIATLAVLGAKSIAGFAGGFASGFHIRPAVNSGLGLSSIGEFAFVVLGTLAVGGAVPKELQQGFLACAALTMSATPLMMRLAGPISQWLEAKHFLHHRRHPDNPSLPRRLHTLENHAVVCGYGPIGENLNDTLKRLGIPTLVVELNANTVQRLVREGQVCIFADISHFETMTLTGIENARVLAITVPQYESACSAIKAARELNPNIFIVCRARYPHHVQALRDLGAQIVVNEEAETSFEILRRTLQQYDRTQEEIADCEREIRFTYGVED